MRFNVSYFLLWENHGHGGHELGVRRGVFGGKLLFKMMSAGGRLCTLQESPHFWVPTIKVRRTDGIRNHNADGFFEKFLSSDLQQQMRESKQRLLFHALLPHHQRQPTFVIALRQIRCRVVRNLDENIRNDVGGHVLQRRGLFIASAWF